MNKLSWLQIANAVSFIAILAFNFLSQSATLLGIKLFPYTVAQLGESRAVFFLPAGYVFAIWGLIYLGMGAYIVYQTRAAQRNDPVIGKIGYWFILSSVGNVGWLILFLNNQIWVSTIAILLILVSLLAIYLRLNIGLAPVSRTVRWAVHIPFSTYLGWVSVATIANIAAALYESGNVTAFLGISADIWTVIMMGAAAILAFAMLWTRGDIAYALVIVWALVGIYARPFNTPVFSLVASLNTGLVHGAALALAIAVALAVIARLLMNQKQASQTLAKAG